MVTPETRPAVEADVPFLLALRQETMEGYLLASGIPCTEASRLERVRDRFECARVVLFEGAPCGLLKVVRAPGAWVVLQLQLAAAMRGRGLGRALLTAVLDEADALRVPVRLDVLRNNPARALYERLGFVVIGEDAHEYLMERPVPR